MLRKPSSLNIDDLAFEHAVRALVPSGETPFAARYNPAVEFVYISCTSGRVITLSVAAIQAKVYSGSKPKEAEVVVPFDIEHHEPTYDGPPKWRAVQVRAESHFSSDPRATQGSKAESESEEGGSDEEDTSDARGGEGGLPPDNQTPEDLWAIAEARCNERQSASSEGIRCGVPGCGNSATVAMTRELDAIVHNCACLRHARHCVAIYGLRVLDTAQE